jgi:hypothetical protein
VLTSLLPGLRDLRTPLAVGYLWLVGLWLLVYKWVPMTVAQAAEGPIKALYQLGSLLGQTVVFAALTFVAYILGSVLRLQLFTKLGSLLPLSVDMRKFAIAPLVAARRHKSMTDQLMTFVAGQIREVDHDDLTRDEQLEILGQFRAPYIHRGYQYVHAISADLEAVAIQLQAKNRDFWDSYDREMAEAQFRYGIVPPLFLIIVLLAIESGSAWWLLLLAIPLLLLYRGILHSITAASTLVQAIVLKMVRPPVLERLSEVVAGIPERRNAEAQAMERRREWKEKEDKYLLEYKLRHKLNKLDAAAVAQSKENGHQASEQNIIGQ